MKLSLILFLVLVTANTFEAVAQASKGDTEPPQRTEELRLQLLEAEAKESELQTRSRQLDEDLKPENIERYFAGVGSTRPEDLRELRRRQLNIEREKVQVQIKLVASSRERLSSALRFAESQAYQESAEGTGAPLQMLRGRFETGRGAMVAVLTSVAGILGIGFLIAAAIRKGKPV
jgi:hypothetical protein